MKLTKFIPGAKVRVKCCPKGLSKYKDKSGEIVEYWNGFVKVKIGEVVKLFEPGELSLREGE